MMEHWIASHWKPGAMTLAGVMELKEVADSELIDLESRVTMTTYELAELSRELEIYARRTRDDLDVVQTRFCSATEKLECNAEITRLAETDALHTKVLDIIRFLKSIKDWDIILRDVERGLANLLKDDLVFESLCDLATRFKPLYRTATLYHNLLPQSSIKHNQIQRVYSKLQSLVTLSVYKAYREDNAEVIIELGKSAYEPWIPTGIQEITERICQAAYMLGPMPFWIDVVNARTHLKISSKKICEYLNIYDLEMLATRALLEPVTGLPPVNYTQPLSASFLELAKYVKSLDGFIHSFADNVAPKDIDPSILKFAFQLRFYQLIIDTIMATLQTEILEGISSNIDFRTADRNNLLNILQEKLTTLFSHYYAIEVLLPRVGLPHCPSHQHKSLAGVFTRCFLPPSLSRHPPIPKLLVAEDAGYLHPAAGRPLLVYLVKLALDVAGAKFDSSFGQIGTARDLEKQFARIADKGTLWSFNFNWDDGMTQLWKRDCDHHLNHLGMRWLVMKLCGFLEKIAAVWETDRRVWGDVHIAGIEALAFSRTVVDRYLEPILKNHWNDHLVDVEFEGEMTKSKLMGNELSWFCQRNHVDMNMCYNTAVEVLEKIGAKMTDKVRRLAVDSFTESIEKNMMKYSLANLNISPGSLESAARLIETADSLQDVLPLLPRDLQMVPSSAVTSSIAECMTLLGRLFSYSEFGRDDSEKKLIASEIKEAILPAILTSLTKLFLERLRMERIVGWAMIWKTFVDTHHMLMHLKTLGGGAEGHLAALTRDLRGVHENLLQRLVEEAGSPFSRRFRRILSPANVGTEAEGSVSRSIDQLILEVQREDSAEPEFVTAFTQLAENLRPVLLAQPSLFPALNALKKPERLVEFKIEWVNAHGERMINKGWRCDYSSALGPCRGGLRLHPTCTTSVMKFLGLEQTIKNGLLNMPMGGGKTGSDFDARNASDYDVRSFARAFVIQLIQVMAPKAPLDIAADLGCGARECAVILEMHRTLENSVSGGIFPAAAGKPWATGLGAVEFAKRMFKIPSFDRKKCVISGCGDVALNVAKHLISEGAQVITLSDTGGYLVAQEGLTFAQWRRLADLRRNRIPLKDIISEDGWLRNVNWFSGSVWKPTILCDYAWPCATENEIDAEVANHLINHNKIKGIIEVSNMPCTAEAIELIRLARISYAPCKAANIGGMTALGLNLAENNPLYEFEHRVRVYVGFVHDQVQTVYEDYKTITFSQAVDICGFMRLAKAAYEQAQW